MKSYLKRLFLTYIKQNDESGEIYSGRASGIDDGSYSEEELVDIILSKRDSSHHKNKEGFARAILDVFSYNSDATRGREQQLIDYNGGAQSEGGTSGNALNSISRKNKKRDQYLEASKKIFGGLGILFLILYSIHLFY